MCVLRRQVCFGRSQSCQSSNQKLCSLGSMEAGDLIHEAYRQGLRKGGCESSGHNESERRGGLVNLFQRPSPHALGEGSMEGRNLIDTAVPLWRGGSDGTMTRTHRATGEALLAPARNCRRKVDTITGGTGKCIEGERVAERRVIAMMRGNACGAKTPHCWYVLFQQGRQR